MRDIIWILGGTALLLLVAVVLVLLELDLFFRRLWSPWRAVYDWVRSERGKKYKSREDVI